MFKSFVIVYYIAIVQFGFSIVFYAVYRLFKNNGLRTFPLIKQDSWRIAPLNCSLQLANTLVAPFAYIYFNYQDRQLLTISIVAVMMSLNLSFLLQIYRDVAGNFRKI